MTPALFALALVAGATTPAEQAERVVATALAEAVAHPDQCTLDAKKAMALTIDFDPVAYVKAGRKGEVVEDQFLAARTEYRHHRAKVYEAMGACLAGAGRHDAAVRYLRRAFDLDPSGGFAPRLARSLLALGRGRAALDVLLQGNPSELSAETVLLLERAADLEGLPSVQAEIDRVRVGLIADEPRPVFQDGPLALPDHSRLSTGAPLQLDSDETRLLYVADTSGRTCSADLEAIKRLSPPTLKVALVPAVPDRDEALRGIVNLYHYTYPYAVGPGIAKALPAQPPAIVLVARRGFVVVSLRSPFGGPLQSALDALSKSDVKEDVPRAGWNRRAANRAAPPGRPLLAEDGFAPGEDDPAPAEFPAALGAFRTGRVAEALAAFERLEARGDGWLLPPEARLDRAICLAALGRREEARRLLLRTGDSRFQDELDRTLERIGSEGLKR